MWGGRESMTWKVTFYVDEHDVDVDYDDEDDELDDQHYIVKDKTVDMSKTSIQETLL